MWKKITSAQALVPVYGKSTRTVSPVVMIDQLCIPVLTDAQRQVWSDAAVKGECIPDEGDVSNLGNSAELVPDALQATVDAWLSEQGFLSAKAHSRAAALMCVGSPFHHDADSYCDEVFCIVWLDAGEGWDLVFPHIDVRVELKPGLLVLFDSGQPHGVVARGKQTFQFGDIGTEERIGSFLSQDLKLTNDTLRTAMQITRHPLEGAPGYEVLPIGTSDDLDTETGVWHIRGHWEPVSEPAAA